MEHSYKYEECKTSSKLDEHDSRNPTHLQVVSNNFFAYYTPFQNKGEVIK